MDWVGMGVALGLIDPLSNVAALNKSPFSAFTINLTVLLDFSKMGSWT